MSSPDEGDDLEEIANAFGRDPDPLPQYEAIFAQMDVDPLDSYVERVLVPKNLSLSTLKNYHHSFTQWRAYMSETGRHYACPNDTR